MRIYCDITSIMKNVLITGGAGFIAHHLIGEILKKTDWSIFTIDRLDFSGNLNRIVDLLKDFGDKEKKRVKVIYHDLKSEINPMISDEIGNVNYIYHLAAGSHVDRSIDNPLEFVYDNVVGTCNILNYARTQKILKDFYISVLMKFLDQHLMVLNIQKMTGITLQTPTVLLKQGVRNLLLHLKIPTIYLFILHTL